MAYKQVENITLKTKLNRLIFIEKIRLLFRNPANPNEKKLVLQEPTFELFEGEVHALIGESGSGKTVLSSLIYGITGSSKIIEKGKIEIAGVEVQDFNERKWQKANLRGKVVSAVFQNPMTTLNPTMKIGNQIIEGILLNKVAKTKKEAKLLAMEYLKKTRIFNPAQIMKMYPHQLSGGMKQRVVIASIVACHPKVIVFDEPTTALDSTVQAEVLMVIKELIKETKLSAVFISHDLGVVASIADRISIMYAGEIVESGTTPEILFKPMHPYTWGLLESMPDLNIGERLTAIPGAVPDNLQTIKGDPFAPRNEFAMHIDYEIPAPYFQVSPTHFVKSWLLHEKAEKITVPKIIKKRWAIYDKQFKKLEKTNKYVTGKGVSTSQNIEKSSNDIQPKKLDFKQIMVNAFAIVKNYFKSLKTKINKKVQAKKMHQQKKTQKFQKVKMKTKIKKITTEERLAEFKDSKKSLVELRDVDIYFGKKNKGIHAVKKVSLNIYMNEVLGLVGESGSGKSTIGNAILGLVDRRGGTIKILNQFLPKQSSKITKKINNFLVNNVQMIFQDPTSSLNPYKKIYKVISEGLDNTDVYNIMYKTFHGVTVNILLTKFFKKTSRPKELDYLSFEWVSEKLLKGKEKEIEEIVYDKIPKILSKNKKVFFEAIKYLELRKTLLSEISINHSNTKRIKKLLVNEAVQSVGLAETVLSRYALEFSGGQQQRIGISRAIVLMPRLLVADEPISSLDVSIQAQVINIFSNLKERLGLTMLFVAHDLRMVEYISDRIAVMYRGNLLEIGEASDVAKNPIHPYTKSLISAVPSIDNVNKSLKAIGYDESMHKYDENNKPEWYEVKTSNASSKHYVYGTGAEVEKWVKEKM